jgi:hypothetical protein
MLKQHATSVASCMVILEQNRRNRHLFSVFPLYFYTSHLDPIVLDVKGLLDRIGLAGIHSNIL